MIKIPRKSLERKIIASGYDWIIGIDEVGMGCLAGPVTVCAILIHKDFYTKFFKQFAHLRDSKLLLAHQRQKYAEELKRQKYIRFALHSCTPATIDRLNIYQASRQAMRKAISKLMTERERGNTKGQQAVRKPDKTKSFILVDGPRAIQKVTLPQQAIIKGDRHIFAIAAASIIAKVHRDTLMDHYAKKFPQYGFEKHKGYGTAFHRQQIKKRGVCPIHRKSFNLIF